MKSITYLEFFPKINVIAPAYMIYKKDGQMDLNLIMSFMDMFKSIFSY